MAKMCACCCPGAARSRAARLQPPATAVRAVAASPPTAPRARRRPPRSTIPAAARAPSSPSALRAVGAAAVAVASTSPPRPAPTLAPPRLLPSPGTSRLNHPRARASCSRPAAAAATRDCHALGGGFPWEAPPLRAVCGPTPPAPPPRRWLHCTARPPPTAPRTTSRRASSASATGGASWGPSTRRSTCAASTSCDTSSSAARAKRRARRWQRRPRHGEHFARRRLWQARLATATTATPTVSTATAVTTRAPRSPGRMAAYTLRAALPSLSSYQPYPRCSDSSRRRLSSQHCSRRAYLRQTRGHGPLPQSSRLPPTCLQTRGSCRCRLRCSRHTRTIRRPSMIAAAPTAPPGLSQAHARLPSCFAWRGGPRHPRWYQRRAMSCWSPLQPPGARRTGGERTGAARRATTAHPWPRPARTRSRWLLLQPPARRSIARLRRRQRAQPAQPAWLFCLEATPATWRQARRPQLTCPAAWSRRVAGAASAARSRRWPWTRPPPQLRAPRSRHCLG